jgi:hypothetical protein
MKHLILKIAALGLAMMLILFSCENKEKITLQYNFKQGDVLKQNVSMNMDLVQKYMGQEMKVSMTMLMKMTLDVKECRDDSYVMDVNYREIKVETAIPSVGVDKISFDSNTEDSVATQTNLGPMFKALVNKPFEMVMTKKGKVESIKGLVQLLESMIDTFDDSVPESARQQIAQQFGSQFSDEAFKSQFEQSLGYFSDEPVAVGDSWNTKTQTNASNFVISIDLNSTLKSIEDNIASIDLDGTVSTPEGFEQDINGTKTKISLKGDYKGTLKLDKNTGWVIVSDIKMNFNGEVEIQGIKVPLYAASTITVTNE